MTQKEKELLLKDLCARLDTNLVCSIYRIDDYGVGYRDEILSGYCKGDIWDEFYFGDDCGIGIDNVSKIKPYLFPLSSITEEQQEEFDRIYADDMQVVANNLKNRLDGKPYETNLGHYRHIDWLNANHFDYRGLIPMGLAIDATGLNIY